MLRSFIEDIRGNFSIITAIAMVPIMGGLALAVDYSEMVRQRQQALNALDAAGIATARRAVEGATEAELKVYAKNFFEANLGGIDPAKASLNIALPSSDAGGGTLKLSADLRYEPYFYPVFTALIGTGQTSTELVFDARSEIRLKNTLEVSLVLDNSGSMDDKGSGSGKKRIVLLKDAAKQLVDTIAQQAVQMKQVDKPVQFALVPFAASVNVGADNANASWMDTDGRSPIHHENFDWATMTGDRKVQLQSGIHQKVGKGWGAQEGQKVTRFTLFDDLQRITSRKCSGTERNGECQNGSWSYTYASYARWEGCVETRPHPYDKDNTPPSQGNPATLFVPMFAPDETDNLDSRNRKAQGNWRADLTTSSNNASRQGYMPKYFEAASLGTAAAATGQGPNASCTTNPITALTDVSTAAGLNKIKAAIDGMQPLGGTNVPEGLAWGWRTVSGGEPFAQGRPDHEKGNDKVVIVLTDGENTYYTPESLGSNDLAGNKSIYSNYGYAARKQPGETKSRLFMGTSFSGGNSDYDNSKYTTAMNEHMDKLCTNAKNAGIILMTVSLDLSEKDSGQKKQIEALRKCSSDSRFRKDPNDPSKPDKLFWNATGGDLADTFKKIADELSNLRIVG
ncbi:TadE/TadG family type IV pilus assembly protein [Aquamicrobium sp. LC103]|uniref:TadE/TadG family type IV pilus assembly protein n=1 Tax=Aquamicrobium sp. LC103 TaxID=1120658 RepID=UPI00063E85E8|nr:TadE/TadG family type IV pilus assembly protein [Aquamicrobium sp. LC103]TKT69175.1 hypothetical protein XW59_028615 [Aquamicrobium sp. LC103]